MRGAKVADLKWLKANIKAAITAIKQSEEFEDRMSHPCSVVVRDGNTVRISLLNSYENLGRHLKRFLESIKGEFVNTTYGLTEEGRKVIFSFQIKIEAS